MNQVPSLGHVSNQITAIQKPLNDKYATMKWHERVRAFFGDVTVHKPHGLSYKSIRAINGIFSKGNLPDSIAKSGETKNAITQYEQERIQVRNIAADAITSKARSENRWQLPAMLATALLVSAVGIATFFVVSNPVILGIVAGVTTISLIAAVVSGYYTAKTNLHSTESDRIQNASDYNNAIAENPLIKTTVIDYVNTMYKAIASVQSTRALNNPTLPDPGKESAKYKKQVQMMSTMADDVSDLLVHLKNLETIYGIRSETIEFKEQALRNHGKIQEQAKTHENYLKALEETQQKQDEPLVVIPNKDIGQGPIPSIMPGEEGIEELGSSSGSSASGTSNSSTESFDDVYTTFNVEETVTRKEGNLHKKRMRQEQFEVVHDVKITGTPLKQSDPLEEVSLDDIIADKLTHTSEEQPKALSNGRYTESDVTKATAEALAILSSKVEESPPPPLSSSPTTFEAISNTDVSVLFGSFGGEDD